MPLEIEVRFRIPTALTAERLMADQLIERTKMRDFTTADMAAEYYDSPGQALRALNSTLRRRTENGYTRVSFKTLVTSGRAMVLTREKWECDTDEISIAIGRLMEMGAPERLSEIAGSEGFLAHGRFEFERRGAPLMLTEGTAVEFDLDRGALFAGGKREEMLELVIKMLYGHPAHLEELAEALEQKYELPRELSSKYERALRLLRSRRPATGPVV